MAVNFKRAFGILLLSLTLLLSYELVYPYIPALAAFEPTHFWTPRLDTSQNSSLTVDTSMTAVDMDSNIQATFDSLEIANPSDSIFIINNDTIFIPDFDSYDGKEYLAAFFEKLQAIKKGKKKRLRIAYFGDSTTEGDLIVGDLRDLLQKAFGGRGVGYVSIAPHGTALRRTLHHRFSPNWKTVNYFRKNKNPKFPFGMSGDYSTAIARSMNKSHTLSFRPAFGNYPTMRYFDQVHLFYGKGNTMDSLNQVPKLYSTINKKDTTSFALNGQQLVNKLTLNQTGCSQVDLAFDFPSPFPIYGLSFESVTGVLVDNFAKRSDSGYHLGRIKSTILQQYYQHLGCDLVVLHYGANVLHEKTDYDYYGRILWTTVRHFQKQMNEVPVLIIGSFLNLFELMGGAGIMRKWASADPPKAAADYVHFNHRGGQAIAKVIFDYLMEGYQEVTGEEIPNPNQRRFFQLPKQK